MGLTVNRQKSTLLTVTMIAKAFYLHVTSMYDGCIYIRIFSIGTNHFISEGKRLDNSVCAQILYALIQPSALLHIVMFSHSCKHAHSAILNSLYCNSTTNHVQR